MSARSVHTYGEMLASCEFLKWRHRPPLTHKHTHTHTHTQNAEDRPSFVTLYGNFQHMTADHDNDYSETTDD